MEEFLHAEIKTTVVVLIALVNCLIPEFFCELFFVVEIGNTCLLIEHVSTFADERNLHSVIFIEMLLEILNQQFSNFCKLTLSLCDTV